MLSVSESTRVVPSVSALLPLEFSQELDQRVIKAAEKGLITKVRSSDPNYCIFEYLSPSGAIVRNIYHIPSLSSTQQLQLGTLQIACMTAQCDRAIASCDRMEGSVQRIETMLDERDVLLAERDARIGAAAAPRPQAAVPQAAAARAEPAQPAQGPSFGQKLWKGVASFFSPSAGES